MITQSKESSMHECRAKKKNIYIYTLYFNIVIGPSHYILFHEKSNMIT